MVMLFVCGCSKIVWWCLSVNCLCEMLSHCRMFWNSGRFFKFYSISMLNAEWYYYHGNQNHACIIYMPRWQVCLEHMSSEIVRGSEAFFKHFHHLSLLDHLWQKLLKNLAGTKWLSLLRKRVCLLWLVYVNKSPTFHIYYVQHHVYRWLKAWVIYSNLRSKCLIPTLPLSWMLIPSLMKWCLTGYTYSQNLVANFEINFIVISGKRLSDNCNQYKSSVCISGPVWSKLLILHILAFNDNTV